MKQKPSSRRRRSSTKSILRLPDLEHAKAAVLNTLNSADAQRGYRHAIDEFVDWYCSEPRLRRQLICYIRDIRLATSTFLSELSPSFASLTPARIPAVARSPAPRSKNPRRVIPLFGLSVVILDFLWELRKSSEFYTQSAP